MFDACDMRRPSCFYRAPSAAPLLYFLSAFAGCETHARIRRRLRVCIVGPCTRAVSYTHLDPANEHDRRSWEEIEKNSRILLNMINNMLDIARSDAGGMRATCEPMDLGDVAASVKGTMAPLARDRKSVV